jgi:hypothetical protein
MAGAASPSAAATTGQVTVSGAIVQVPASITITTPTIGFGNMDAKGTPQSPVQANGYLGGGGAYWVTNSAIVIKVSSPTAWNGSVCMPTSAGLPSGEIRILRSDNLPTGTGDAQSKVDGGIKPAKVCTSPSPWITNGAQTSETTFNLHLGTFLSDADAPKSFGATLTFSVVNLP